MFLRAGTGGTQKRKIYAGASAQATPTSSCGTSPAKVIDNHSKCYKQLANLNNLKQSDLLSEAEYASEHEAVISMLKINFYNVGICDKILDTGKDFVWYCMKALYWHYYMYPQFTM